MAKLTINKHTPQKEKEIMFPGLYNIDFETSEVILQPINLNSITKADIIELIKVMSNFGATKEESEKALSALASKPNDIWTKRLRKRIGL